MQSGSTELPPEALRSRLRAWLFARVVIVTVFLGAVVAAHLSSDLGVGFPLRPLAALIAIAYAVSIASAYGVDRVADLRTFALTQVIFDILLNSAAVLLTGALTSPMGV